MLTVLDELAEFERELIKDRTDAGRVRAKARGVKFGRKTEAQPVPAGASLGAAVYRRDAG